MKIKNTKTCYTYTIQFTEEEFEIIKEGQLPDRYLYFTTFLWCSEIEDYLEEAEIYYMSQQVEIILSENKLELVKKVVQEFLNNAEIV